MKNILTAIPIILILLFVVACKKEPESISPIKRSKTELQPGGNPFFVKADTLTGKEFMFTDLKWTHAGQGAITEEEIWIGVENRPDLFGDSQRPLEVAVKFDTASAWLPIPKWDGTLVPSGVGFVHLIMYGNSFYIESFPMNFSLINRKASLKIKFL